MSEDPFSYGMAYLYFRKAREDEKNATARLHDMIANYGDVIPRRDFEGLEKKFNVCFQLILLTVVLNFCFVFIICMEQIVRSVDDLSQTALVSIFGFPSLQSVQGLVSSSLVVLQTVIDWNELPAVLLSSTDSWITRFTVWDL